MAEISANMELSQEASSDSNPVHADRWDGFKLVRDNIDKNIPASYQRFDPKTQSLHYFHVYAVLDRVDFSGLSDEAPVPSSVPCADDIRKKCPLWSLSNYYLDTLYSPSLNDKCPLRIILKHMESFRKQAKDVEWHIPNRLS